MHNLIEKIRDFFWRLFGNPSNETAKIEISKTELKSVVPKFALPKSNTKVSKAVHKAKTTKTKPKHNPAFTKSKSRIPAQTTKFTAQPHPFKKDRWIVVTSQGNTIFEVGDQALAEVAAQEYTKARAAYDVKLKSIRQRPIFDPIRHEEKYGDWKTD